MSTARRYVLYVGLAVLVLVNLYDLAGTLRLGLTSTTVALASMAWLGVWVVLAGADRADLRAVSKAVAILVVVGVLEAFVTGVMHPTADPHYRLYATGLGMAAQSNVTVGLGPLVILAGCQLLWRLEDYWHLRRTTAEERVLGPEDSPSTTSTETSR